MPHVNPEERARYFKAYREKHREHINSNRSAWKKKNSNEYYGKQVVWNRWSNLKKLYGLTKDDYQWLLEKQGFKCAICGCQQSEKMLAVDHDHVTGLVRGLLCSPCNAGLGSLGDSVTGLKRAIDYLKKHEEEKQA